MSPSCSRMEGCLASFCTRLCPCILPFFPASQQPHAKEGCYHDIDCHYEALVFPIHIGISLGLRETYTRTSFHNILYVCLSLTHTNTVYLSLSLWLPCMHTNTHCFIIFHSLSIYLWLPHMHTKSCSFKCVLVPIIILFPTSSCVYKQHSVCSFLISFPLVSLHPPLSVSLYPPLACIQTHVHKHTYTNTQTQTHVHKHTYRIA